MNNCKNCLLWDDKYDKNEQELDDMIILSEKRERHHCLGYRNYIPFEIYYDGQECPKYTEKREE